MSLAWIRYHPGIKLVLMNEARYEARQRKTEAQMVLAGQFTTAVKDRA